ncbi:hypothetical protein EQG63_05785 [Flavobacterium amnicola]|uniref:Uncharacterized protein n=1 Tax=Flavobacterium amnicola TaxID=2506422 RepID=A0A4Q1K238_9FLAO|nr:hypothetical protein [Flavobacterium amnicola]RXR18955.1 hypothetical protein EQG63_05785 [Flavobacterium amnicola]
MKNFSLKRIKEQLEENKIFFEIIYIGLLSFMAVFVSIQANNISDNQTKIMEFENTPKIEIRSKQVYNDTLGYRYKEKWLIYNKNSKLSNFDVLDTKSFLVYHEKQISTRDSIIFPINHYINTSGTLFDQNEGLLYEFDNEENGLYFRNLDLATKQNGYLQINNYIKISYSTVLNNNIEKYYQISPIIQEIPLKEWEKITNLFIDKSESMVSLIEIDSTKFKKMIKNYRY